MLKPQLPSYLDNVYVILCHPSHPSNIGSSARAMKTMGLKNLILIAPQLISTPMTPEPPFFDAHNIQSFKIPPESYTLSSNAHDLLDNCKIYASLEEALAPMNLSFGFTSKKREITAPLELPRDAAPQMLEAARENQKVAWVFGNERYGLLIDELNLCNHLVTIKGNPNYMSLNLSQAVQIMCYELFTHVDEVDVDYLKEYRKLASQDKVYGLVEHFEDVMQEVGFLERKNPERLMRHVKMIFDRAQLDDAEIDILRGFLKTTARKIKNLEDKMNEK